MKGKLYLSGGGGIENFHLYEKEAFLEVNNILYIPLAWERDDSYESCRNWFESMLKSHGNPSYRMIKSSSENFNLAEFDMVYIGGGNTFKLLKDLKESGLGNRILEYLRLGGKVYGGSAGAIIFGTSILTCEIGCNNDENSVGLRDFSGFNLFEGNDIQCHYSDEELDLHRQYSKKNNRKVLAIPESEILVYEGKNLNSLGLEKAILIGKKGIEKTYD